MQRLSRQELTAIKAEIERLETALSACNDSGIRKQIEVWIDEQKEKLISANSTSQAPYRSQEKSRQ